MNKFQSLIITVLYLIFLQSCTTNSDLIRLKNEKYGETIYLRYNATTESSLISLNHFSDIDSSYDIVVSKTGVFFYKFDNDSLILYDYSLKMPPAENIRKKYKTKIAYREMVNGNADFVDFAKIYKSKGFKFFPPSLEYMVQNR